MPCSPRPRLLCAPLLCLVLMVMMVAGCSAAYRQVAAMERAPAPRSTPADVAAAQPETDAPPPRDGAAVAPVAHARQVIYTGSMTLRTSDAEDAMRRIQLAAEGLGGFLGRWESGRITIRVPVGRLREAIERIEGLGSVSDKQLDALDVTDQMRDLEARIDNAEAMRQRLVALVERSGEIDDLLKVEQELARVTEQKERLEAQLASLREGAAFSTLAVRVIEAQPQRKPTYNVNMPFAWINTMGTDLRRGGGDFGSAHRKLGKGVTIDLPEGYVRFMQRDYTTIAMSASQVMIKVRRHDNYDHADAAFWSRLIERHLSRSGLIEVEEQDTITIRDQKAALVLRGSRAFGQGDFGYLIAVAVSDDHVYTFEAWGPTDDFAAARLQLEAAIKTLNADSGWSVF